MKLWIHLSELLGNIKTPDGRKIQIVDIQLALSKQPKHFIIYKMEDIKNQIQDIKQNINAGNYGTYQLFSKNKEIQKLEQKYERLNEKHFEAIKEEKKNAQNPTLVPKQLLLQEIEYVFVTLKTNLYIGQVLEMFVKENNASYIIRKCCCIDDEVLDNVEFDDQSLNI